MPPQPIGPGLTAPPGRGGGGGGGGGPRAGVQPGPPLNLGALLQGRGFQQPGGRGRGGGQGLGAIGQGLASAGRSIGEAGIRKQQQQDALELEERRDRNDSARQFVDQQFKMGVMQSGRDAFLQDREMELNMRALNAELQEIESGQTELGAETSIARIASLARAASNPATDPFGSLKKFTDMRRQDLINRGVPADQLSSFADVDAHAALADPDIWGPNVHASPTKALPFDALDQRPIAPDGKPYPNGANLQDYNNMLPMYATTLALAASRTARTAEGKRKVANAILLTRNKFAEKNQAVLSNAQALGLNMDPTDPQNALTNTRTMDNYMDSLDSLLDNPELENLSAPQLAAMMLRQTSPNAAKMAEHVLGVFDNDPGGHDASTVWDASVPAMTELIHLLADRLDTRIDVSRGAERIETITDRETGERIARIAKPVESGKTKRVRALTEYLRAYGAGLSGYQSNSVFRISQRMVADETFEKTLKQYIQNHDGEYPNAESVALLFATSLLDSGPMQEGKAAQDGLTSQFEKGIFPFLRLSPTQEFMSMASDQRAAVLEGPLQKEVEEGTRVRSRERAFEEQGPFQPRLGPGAGADRGL